MIHFRRSLRAYSEILERLEFPAQLGRCHSNPLLFFDTNILVDDEDFVRKLFKNPSIPDSELSMLCVICDFVQGELLNLKKRAGILDDLRAPVYSGYQFVTAYNSRDGSERALEDMPNPEMKEVVLVEYDRKLDPSGVKSETKEAKRASASKSRFVDFSLITVATVSAHRRKRLSLVLSRDRWVKLSCKALEERFHLPIYCYDQWTFSIEEILRRTR